MYLPPQFSIQMLEGVLIGMGIMSFPSLILVLFAWVKSEPDTHNHLHIERLPDEKRETNLVRKE
jgi:hypothetical protein